MKMAAGHLRLTDSPSPKRTIDFDKIRFNLHLSLGKGKRVRRTPPRGRAGTAPKRCLAWRDFPPTAGIILHGRRNRLSTPLQETH